MTNKTILLVDDDAEIRDALQDVLEERGYDVIPAGTGRDALAYLASVPESPPDLVVLDLMMPLVTGWQVLDEIHADPRLANVPVVVMTAVSKDKPTGMSAFLRKPIQLDTFISTVEQQLRV